MIKNNIFKNWDDARYKCIFKNHTVVSETADKKSNVGLTFKNFRYDNSSSVIFKNRSFGYNYLEVGYERIEETIDCFQYLYELITNGMNKKYYFDLDFDILVSLNDMTELANAFILFINTFYNTGEAIEIKYNILASINKDTDKPPKGDNDRIYKSIHIIFNIFTPEIGDLQLIITDFKRRSNNVFSGFIDLSAYSSMRLMRAYGQRKEKLGRTDRLRIINGNDNIRDTLITHISPNDILFKLETKTTNEKPVEVVFNVVYNIDDILEKLEKHINKLEITELTKTRWFNNLFDIIHILRIHKCEWSDILTNPLIKLFLKRSVIPNYDTDKIKTHNIEIIKLILFKQPKTTLNNSKLLTELNEEQLTFIYKKINIENTELLSITEESINNRIYLHLTAKTKLYLWDTRNQILLCDYNNRKQQKNHTYRKTIQFVN